MTDDPLPAKLPLQIRQPCPKSWAELEGDEQKRFCSACSLHVHNAAQLTQREAQTLVLGSKERVCMRIEYDSAGAPLFRDTRPTLAAESRRVRPGLQRYVLWAVSATASLLAACFGKDERAGAASVEPPSGMGKVVSTLMGNVALPPQQSVEILGEMTVAPDPATPEAPTSVPEKDAR